MSVVPIYRAGWTISLDHLRSLCGHQVAAVEKHPFFREYGGWGGVCAELGDDANSISTAGGRHDATPVDVDTDITPAKNDEGSDGDSDADFMNLLAELMKAFKEVTGGLTLSFEFYDEDGGDGHDIVTHIDGCVFLVDGVTNTTFTLPSERLRHLVNKQEWMQVG